MGSCVSGASQDLRSLRELHSAEVPRKSATRLVREEGWAGLLLQSKQARIWLQAQIQRGNVDETAQETEETEQARRPQFAPLSVFSRSFCLSLCFTDRWMSGPAAWCLVMISPSRLKAAAEQSRAQQRREEQREEREEERHRLHLAANTLSAFTALPDSQSFLLRDCSYRHAVCFLTCPNAKREKQHQAKGALCPLTLSCKGRNVLHVFLHTFMESVWIILPCKYNTVIGHITKYTKQ